MRVLLIDDDPDTQNVLSMMSSSVGIHLDVSSSVQGALEFLRNNTQPDVIVVDMRLPDGNGFQILDMLRKENLASTAKYVAISAYYTMDTQREVMDKGFHAFYAKPIPVTSFIPELQQLAA